CWCRVGKRWTGAIESLWVRASASCSRIATGACPRAYNFTLSTPRVWSAGQAHGATRPCPLIREKHMLSALLCDLTSLAAMVPHGAKLAVPSANSGVAMAATRELVRREVRGLHLVCVPVGGLQTDIMIGAGLVDTVETSAVTLGEFGSAPRFAAALREQRVHAIDATCPAIHAALQAAQKGIPFIPLRGLIGTDVLANHPDWKVIDNPFRPGDPIVLLSAIQPDIALFHAPLADHNGNVF